MNAKLKFIKLKWSSGKTVHQASAGSGTYRIIQDRLLFRCYLISGEAVIPLGIHGNQKDAKAWCQAHWKDAE